MPKQNFKSHTKRKRELAKLDKRVAKEQKRASRRAEPAGLAVTAESAGVPTGGRSVSAVAEKPRTLAEAVERWKKTKVGLGPKPR